LLSTDLESGSEKYTDAPLYNTNFLAWDVVVVLHALVVCTISFLPLSASPFHYMLGRTKVIFGVTVTRAGPGSVKHYTNFVRGKRT